MIAADSFKSYLELLGQRLEQRGIAASIILFGGGAMALQYAARTQTQDLDVYYRTDNRELVQEIAEEIAREHGLDTKWINDRGKIYLTSEVIASAQPFLICSSLEVLTPSAEALLAMKILSMRMGPGLVDYGDAKFLTKELDLRELDDALEIVYRFYPKEKGRLKPVQILGIDNVIQELARERGMQ